MGALFSTVFSFLAGPLLDKIIAPLTHIFDAYINKQITEAQLREQVQALLIGAFKEIEVAHADALTKMYATMMGAAVQSPLIAGTWAFVTISQGVMLLWFQFGIPFIIAIGIVKSWPSAGSTADWSYALVGALLGLGMTLGKSSGGIVGSLKALVGK